MKRILITAATRLEIDGLITSLDNVWQKTGPLSFVKNGIHLELLVTGVGPVLTAYNMGKRSNVPRPDLALQIGIAGSLKLELKPGELVEIRQDEFGFWGARDADDTPLNVFKLGLCDPDNRPFQDGKLINPFPPIEGIQQCSGITVMETTGTADGKKIIEQHYPADIETMEGASFMYACLENDWRFHCIRAISNYVGPRDRSSWKITEALQAVTTFAMQYLEEKVGR